MLGEILDAQLHLRLFHFVLPPLVVAIAQLPAHDAQRRFLRLHRSGDGGAFLHQALHLLVGFHVLPRVASISPWMRSDSSVRFCDLTT